MLGSQTSSIERFHAEISGIADLLIFFGADFSHSRQSERFQSSGSTLTYVPHFSQKGQISPADDMSLTKRRIRLPQAAHLTRIPRTLFSFMRKAESTPVSGHSHYALLVSKGAPGRLGSAKTSFLSRCIASAGSTPFGQTKEHAPAKWHLQIP